MWRIIRAVSRERACAGGLAGAPVKAPGGNAIACAAAATPRHGPELSNAAKRGPSRAHPPAGRFAAWRPGVRVATARACRRLSDMTRMPNGSPGQAAATQAGGRAGVWPAARSLREYPAAFPFRGRAGRFEAAGMPPSASGIGRARRRTPGLPGAPRREPRRPLGHAKVAAGLRAAGALQTGHRQVRGGPLARERALERPAAAPVLAPKSTRQPPNRLRRGRLWPARGSCRAALASGTRRRPGSRPQTAPRQCGHSGTYGVVPAG